SGLRQTGELSLQLRHGTLRFELGKLGANQAIIVERGAAAAKEVQVGAENRPGKRWTVTVLGACQTRGQESRDPDRHYRPEHGPHSCFLPLLFCMASSKMQARFRSRESGSGVRNQGSGVSNLSPDP